MMFFLKRVWLSSSDQKKQDSGEKGAGKGASKNSVPTPEPEKNPGLGSDAATDPTFEQYKAPTEEQTNAATKIQALYRGVLARKQALSSKPTEDALNSKELTFAEKGVASLAEARASVIAELGNVANVSNEINSPEAVVSPLDAESLFSGVDRDSSSEYLGTDDETEFMKGVNDPKAAELIDSAVAKMRKTAVDALRDNPALLSPTRTLNNGGN